MFLKSLKDILNFRDLIIYLVKADFKSKYSGTILGYLWWLLDPLLFMMVYVLLIGVILGRGGPDYPVFLICSLIPWKFTAASINDSINSISGKLKMINQIYLPVIVFPIIKCINNLINLGFGFLLVIFVLLLYKVNFTFYILYLPLIVLIQFIFNLSIGLILANWGVFFKDIQNIMQSFVLRAWFYLSPILYSMDRVPDRLVKIFMLNPISTLMISYRNILLFGKPPQLVGLLIVLLFSVLLYTTATFLIYKNYGKYAKVI